MSDLTRDYTMPTVAGDPDLADFDDVDDLDDGPVSDLDAIEAELGDDKPEPVEIKVDGRPGYTLLCRTDFTFREVEALRGKAKDPAFKRSNGGVDPAKHAALLIGTMTLEIRRLGKPLALDGKPPTFGNKELQRILGCVPGEGVVAAVRRLYRGQEFRIIAASDKVLEEAGWADEAVTADPTE